MDEEVQELHYSKPPMRREILAAVGLFSGTAAVVAWQNSRLTVLYDLCGVLENAHRISLGDVPYRDFPFPYAPLTFLIQALIIKITGAVYWHHILYCALVGGAATVVTWRIILNLLRGRIPAAHLTAFLLSLPLMILGIYDIFPHPFYDPDAVFIILLALFLGQRLERKNFPVIKTLLVGMLLIVPLFSKQNIGLAFLGAVMLSLAVLMAVNRRRNQSVKGYLILSAGAAAGLAIAAAIIHSTAGLGNYWFWTMTYAQMRRTPSVNEMLSVYQDWSLFVWIPLMAIGAILFWRNRTAKSLLNVPAILLMSAPFIWTVVYLFINADNSERAERLVGVFPLMFIVSGAAAILTLKHFKEINATLPFILIATMHGVFLSQQLWGSTYAVWSLLMILTATLLPFLHRISNAESSNRLAVLAAIISLSLLISGGFYVYSNERLDYVNFNDGALAHSKLPPLAGLSMRGSYISDFEELVDYADKNIPFDDGILIIPGEDLFNYTTGRHPHFSVILFDITNNPLSPEQILEQVKERDIRWLITKNDLEIEVDQTIDDRNRLLEVLKPEFKHAESLDNYEIFRRRTSADADDEDDADADGEPESQTAP